MTKVRASPLAAGLWLERLVFGATKSASVPARGWPVARTAGIWSDEKCECPRLLLGFRSNG
ncbi:MAG: hypothetical protein MUE44_26520 [Oscillatoriaceae cyanobacterium Prado104]|nr:hypothetical protein [Oscillatoriaceae cyanobacterium Prado104]